MGVFQILGSSPVAAFVNQTLVNFPYSHDVPPATLSATEQWALLRFLATRVKAYVRWAETPEVGALSSLHARVAGLRLVQ